MTETRAKYETLRGNQNAAKPAHLKARQHQFRLYPYPDEANLKALLAVNYALNATEVVRWALADALKPYLDGDYGPEVAALAKQILAEARERTEE